MDKISVIVPIYHGKKYMDAMIAQVEAAYARAREKCRVELLFVNDDPGETLGEYDSPLIEIACVETEANRGIHGARARGLGHASGDFILFLDQDDRIEEDYFKSQLSSLEDADVAVCRLLHEKKQFYDTRMPFEEVVSKQFMMSQRCSIISPGQALMRKDAIPDVWKNARLENSGADDWLLWICMMAEGKRFHLNPEILFEHVVDGHNASMDAWRMIQSEREMLGILSRSRTLAEDELSALHDAVLRAERERVMTLCRFQKMFSAYHAWIGLQNKGISIADYLQAKNIKTVAVYAAGHLGKSLFCHLQREGIRMEYFIDINADFLEAEAPIYKLNQELPEADMVIISLVDYEDGLQEILAEKTGAAVLGINDLLRRMEQEFEA